MDPTAPTSFRGLASSPPLRFATRVASHDVTKVAQDPVTLDARTMACGWRVALGLIAMLSFGACGRIEETTLNDQACDVLCECNGQVLPTSHRQCMSTCVDQLPSFSQACLECIGESSCSQLGADACDDVCF